MLRFSDALVRGSCKKIRNQTVTDAYQSDNLLAETKKQSGFCVIHRLFTSGSRTFQKQITDCESAIKSTGRAENVKQQIQDQ